MTKPKFPGQKNMTVDEVRVMARVCKNDGCDIGKTNIDSIDDSLTVLRSSVIMNYHTSKPIRRTTAKKLIEARIMQAKILRQLWLRKAY